jgi:hypothetical protein
MAAAGTTPGQEDHFMDRQDGRLPNAWAPLIKQ